jgi:hypothetical protein
MRDISKWWTATVIPVAIAIAACDDINAGLNGPGSIRSTLVSTQTIAQPSVVQPQFIVDPSCRTTPPFFALLDVSVNPQTDLFLQSIVFELVDQSGRTAVPTVSAVSGISTTIPASTPIPLTGSVPIPGQVSFNGLPISPGQPQANSFALRFDCGVQPSGTLFVTVQSSNRLGETDVSRASAHMGG